MHKVVAWGRHLIVEPTAAHAATLVWMHGLGDSAHGFSDVFADPRFTLPGLRTVLLTADPQPVTLNGGMVMNSWYDIQTLGKRELGDDALESAAKVSKILESEARNTQHLFIGGFSQGAALALLLAYSIYPGALAGVIALSGYCFPIDIPETRKSIPALIYHGEQDPMVPLHFSRQSYRNTLEGVNYTYKTVPGMQHSVDIEELQDVRRWIQTQISPKDKL